MVPQGATQIRPAVKDTKTADAENDTVPHIIQRNPSEDPQWIVFINSLRLENTNAPNNIVHAQLQHIEIS